MLIYIRISIPFRCLWISLCVLSTHCGFHSSPPDIDIIYQQLPFPAFTLYFINNVGHHKVIWIELVHDCIQNKRNLTSYF